MRARLASLILSLLAACGGGSGGKPTTPIGNNTGTSPQDVPAPLYAALFVDGATVRFAAQHKNSHHDDTDPNANASGMVSSESTSVMTCEVSKVTELSAAIAAFLDCAHDTEQPFGGTTPSGYYVATAAGLWRIDEVPTDAVVATLGPETMLLGADPKPVAPASRPGDTENGASRSVEQRGDGAWCANESTWGRDESSLTTCFMAGIGMVGGSAHFGGASTHDMTFERLK